MKTARRMTARLIALALAGALALAFAHSCVVADDLPAIDAQSEIYAAIAYKEGSCGQRPDFLLIVPEAPSAYGTQLCSISIIRMDCPFDRYPTYCLELYNIDIPGIGP